MTPEERQLITGLFDRMRAFALTGKDSEAESLIKQQAGSLPDAPYMLVQSVLVLEQALQQADGRVKALEEQVRSLQETEQRAPSAGTGSFLGGLFGSRVSEPERGPSVPAVGARATPSVYGSGQSAWGAPQSGTPTAPPPPTGGSFLQSAMATAAGVAGGMLAASAISSWLGGSGNTHTGSTASAQQTQPTAADTTTGGATPASHQTDPSGEPQGDSYHQAAYEDDGGWFGGDDFEA
jgi:uncharacterized protein